MTDETFTFEAELFLGGDIPGAGVFVIFPYSVEEKFGTRGQVRVRGTVDGEPYQAALAPYGGRHMMIVRKDVRTKIGKAPGDTVTVVIQRDTQPRTLEIAEDVRAALASHPDVQARWSTMAFSHHKEYLTWIEEAKKPETRANRIAQMLEMVAEGKSRR